MECSSSYVQGLLDSVINGGTYNSEEAFDQHEETILKYLLIKIGFSFSGN